MHARLKVPAKNSPALLFLSRVKAADCCCFSFFFFSPAEEEQSRRIFGGNFQTRAHDGNKAAGLKVTTCLEGPFELTQRPSWALDSPRALLPELQRYKDTLRCGTLGAEVPGHRKEQLTQTLIVRLLETHLFLLFQKLGEGEVLP